ncbi:SARP family transcriptional regulator [Virgisporangium aliadipatigenens]|uniref:SARP family transcriptional regulator n=1 Tax=Virgisporangium aliadipatigenens TaxID=741659 RepID=A0A8J3YKJ2_9ACTN|nr:BTAD domain-containing putative transcriptional regulator [Virgisporangium aliadipatigenens]GIJ46112.1 SARP family transcriptional regulator [Virgisporangium aliadipatigenens]
MAVEFQLLGEVRAHRPDRPVDLGSARQRSLLAILLVDSNRVIPVHQLVDRLWSEDPPPTARPTLRSYLSRLRSVLADDETVSLERCTNGYRLRVDPARIDLHRFRGLIAQARAAANDRGPGGDRRALRLFDDAMRLWSGDVFGGLDCTWLADLRERLHGERLAAELDRVDVALRGDRPAGLVAGLAELSAAHPLDERVAGQLMLALHLCGRRADALGAYRAIRRRLADEMGVEPGPALQRLHRRLLAGDPAPVVGPPANDPSPADPVPDPRPGGLSPAELPPDLPAFVGREHELAQLDGLLPAKNADRTAAVIATITGAAGVGKTVLAVHWAHLVRHRFPDGQLHVNLRGFSPDSSALTPAEALRGLLGSLGVPPTGQPADLAGRVGLYRTLLADRRILILLDDAHSAEQVRPLLPGAPGCLAVVTSRDQLTGLAVAAGAHPLPLDLLSAAQARDLLARRLGPARVAGEPDAVTQIVERCARLPLALTIVAARAARQPHFPLGAVAAGLVGDDRLDVLGDGDPTTDLRTVFSWSYRRLGAPAARLFRLLGLLPAGEASVAAVASLAGLPPRRLHAPLGELRRASLVDEPAPGRLSLHDLLRAYAGELVEEHEPPDARRAAAGRLLDHYLHTAHAAAVAVDPQRDPIPLPAARPGTAPQEFTGSAAALAWFTSEQQTLLNAVIRPEPGSEAHTWRLAWCLVNILDRRGLWVEQAAAHTAALACAERLADPAGQAHTLRGLARAYVQLGRYDEAERHFRVGLERCRDAGDRVLAAHLHRNLAELEERRDRYATAVRHAARAITLFRAAGHRIGLANSLNQLGWYLTLLGEHRQALSTLERAMVLLTAIDHRYGQAAALDSIGYAHFRLGDLERAVECLERSLALFRAEGDRYYATVTMVHLGDAHDARGDADAARAAWQAALEILVEMRHPDAESVRKRLLPGVCGSTTT